jgi:hypothetical protein
LQIFLFHTINQNNIINN